MDYQAMYRAKLTDKETAMDLVHSGDRVMTYGGANVFLTSLCERADRLENVELYTMFMLNQDYPFLRGETEGHIEHFGTSPGRHPGPLQRHRPHGARAHTAPLPVCHVHPHG